MKIERIEHEAGRLLALCQELREENERLQVALGISDEARDRDKTGDFHLLVSIVAGAFRASPEMVASRARRQRYTAPRHLVAAIWAETHTMPETARRMQWRSHVNVTYARGRALKMLEDPKTSELVHKIVERVKTDMPWLLEKNSKPPETNEL